MKVICAADLAPVPWKNGSGTTRELDCYPEGAGLEEFAWRVSLADVNSSCAFSTFAQVDRKITLIEGDDFSLVFDDGEVHHLRPEEPFSFAGERPVRCEVQGGLSRDLNLMVRRHAVDGKVEVLRDRTQLAPVSTTRYLLFCMRGSWTVHAGASAAATLKRHDYARLRQGEGAEFTPASVESAALLLTLAAPADARRAF